MSQTLPQFVTVEKKSKKQKKKKATKYIKTEEKNKTKAKTERRRSDSPKTLRGAGRRRPCREQRRDGGAGTIPDGTA